MSSKFQSLNDLRRKRNSHYIDYENILLMKDGNLNSLNNRSYYKKKNKNRLKNEYLYRCVLTGRDKGVITKYKLTRMAFKSFTVSGFIPGMYKFSW